jgi:hypothetical protein
VARFINISAIARSFALKKKSLTLILASLCRYIKTEKDISMNKDFFEYLESDIQTYNNHKIFEYDGRSVILFNSIINSPALDG